MTSKRIEIITDSTCDIPQPLLEQYSITVLPHTVIWGTEQFRDRLDMQPEAFYRRLGSDKTMPTTSQASALEFAEAYRQALERGADEVVALIVSSGLSGAYQSAQQAKELALEGAKAIGSPVEGSRIQGSSIPIYVYDSKDVTMALGFQVLAAARTREAGGDAADMLAAADKVRQRVQLYIGLDTLEYVYRGGRIGNASRFVGSMLNIKPLLYVDHDSGVVEPAGMALTRRKAINMLYDKFFAQLDKNRPMHIAVLHGDAADDAAMLMERVQQEYHPAELITNITGPILGIHTGSGAFALAGYSE